MDEDSDVQNLSQKTCDEALANVKVLSKVEFYNPEFFTKANSDEDPLFEDSRIEDVEVQACTSKVKDFSSCEVN